MIIRKDVIEWDASSKKRKHQHKESLQKAGKKGAEHAQKSHEIHQTFQLADNFEK